MKRTSSWVVGIVVVLVLSGNVLAQELATLKVTVNDQSGAVIPGATVTLKNTATGAKRTDVTESHGLSVIPGLPPGSYELTAEAKRSEEHTSELQSRFDLVCRLLLEKKK